jgi:hypothetical protein
MIKFSVARAHPRPARPLGKQQRPEREVRHSDRTRPTSLIAQPEQFGRARGRQHERCADRDGHDSSRTIARSAAATRLDDPRTTDHKCDGPQRRNAVISRSDVRRLMITGSNVSLQIRFGNARRVMLVP